MNASQSTTPQFTGLRKILFPIYTFELKKVLPMAMIFFFILFNYTCLRNIKDSLVVVNAGAPTLSFLKTFCVFPASIVFMLCYAYGSNILSNEKLFYATLTPFIVFFGAFAYVIYPNLDYLHPSVELVTSLKTSYPWAEQFFNIFGYWTFSLFYVLAEIWGSAILSLSFWQFANQTCKTSEAKRFYAFFGLVAQLAMIATGGLGKYFSDIRDSVPEGVDPWGVSLNWLMGMVVVAGLLCMFTYRWVYKNVLTDKRFYDKPHLPGVVSGESEKKGGKKKKPSLTESFKIIFSSPYLGLIALLVIAYGVSINLLEGTWKAQLKLKYPQENDYNTFMSTFTIYTGIAAMIMLMVGSNLLRLLRWVTVAMVTPLAILLGGITFFTFYLFRAQLTDVLANFGTDPISMAVLMGAGIVVVTKATKYALFDLTKEMAYIPLDEDMKVKGKAVVDVVGGRFGKSGGAGFQAALFMIFPLFTGVPGVGYDDIAPYVVGGFLLICFVWVYAVKKLGVRVEAARAASADK